MLAVGLGGAFRVWLVIPETNEFYAAWRGKVWRGQVGQGAAGPGAARFGLGSISEQAINFQTREI